MKNSKMHNGKIYVSWDNTHWYLAKWGESSQMTKGETGS